MVKITKKNTKKKTRLRRFSHDNLVESMSETPTVSSVTGTLISVKRESNNNNNRISDNNNNSHLRMSYHKEFLFKTMLFLATFCISFAFAASASNISTVNIASHNLHGFKKSSTYHKACLQSHPGIWMAQELWLTEKQLQQLTTLGTQFTARSGMQEAISAGILTGRPFGGVSIAWSPQLNHLVNPLSNYVHKRVVGIEFKDGDKNILILCTYMPYYNASRRAECLSETTDVLTMLEAIITDHPISIISL